MAQVDDRSDLWCSELKFISSENKSVGEGVKSEFDAIESREQDQFD